MTVTDERITDATELPEDLTEIVKMEATRVDGVLHPANGAPFLLMKHLQAGPGFDRIGLDRSGPEPDEDDIPDPCPNCGQPMPMAHGGTSGNEMKIQKAMEDEVARCEALGDLIKAHRDFSMDERRNLAGKGQALDDGSYPIPDNDALRRAAILARSGHGNVAAARALIAKRARELGVANPLEKKPKMKQGGSKRMDMAKSTGDTPADDTGTPAGYIPRDEFDQLVKQAVVEAREADRAVIESLQANMAKMMDQPRPGGPVASAPGAQSASTGSEADAELAKALGYERTASRITDPVKREGYFALAEEARQKARELAG